MRSIKSFKNSSKLWIFVKRGYSNNVRDTLGGRRFVKVSRDIFPNFWTIFLYYGLLSGRKNSNLGSNQNVTLQQGGWFRASVTKWHMGEGVSKIGKKVSRIIWMAQKLFPENFRSAFAKLLQVQKYKSSN